MKQRGDPDVICRSCGKVWQVEDLDYSDDCTMAFCPSCAFEVDTISPETFEDTP